MKRGNNRLVDRKNKNEKKGNRICKTTSLLPGKIYKNSNFLILIYLSSLLFNNLYNSINL